MASECGPVFLSGGLEKGEGASVNDGISPDKFTLHYTTVDQNCSLSVSLGERGSHG